ETPSERSSAVPAPISVAPNDVPRRPSGAASVAGTPPGSAETTGSDKLCAAEGIPASAVVAAFPEPGAAGAAFTSEAVASGANAGASIVDAVSLAAATRSAADGLLGAASPGKAG